MIVDRVGASLHLVDIALLPTSQGRGIGTALLRELQNEASAFDLSITLFVRANNSSAIRLYERLGFCPLCESDTDLRMTWIGAKDE